MRKFIDFIITQKCSYHCSYCSQSKCEQDVKTNASKKTIDNFLKFLDRLNDKSFEITITGGEAILHPDFIYLIDNVKQKGYKINLISNFSFDIQKYIDIFKILGNSLNEFAVSFHLEQIKDFNETISKLNKLMLYNFQNAKFLFLIPIFNLDKTKEKQIDEIIKIAIKNNIEYNFQRIRIFNKHKKILKNEEKYFENETKIKSFSKKCYAGCNSAVIYEDGSVYSCYSSRFLKTNYLGNINDKNFGLNKKPMVCTSKYCTCPKPYKYGQISDKKNIFNGAFAFAYNLLNSPTLMLKNMNIIATKTKQYLKYMIK